MKFFMINSILPTLPQPIRIPSTDTVLNLIAYSLFLALTMMTAFLISQYAAFNFNGNKKKTAFAFIGISVFVAAVLLCFFGCAVSALQGILFCLILVFSSYSDIKTRESDDSLAVMTMLTAFIGKDVTDVPMMLLSAVLITIPMFLVLIVCKGKAVGGADVKLTAACGFLLGLSRGTIGLMAGLLIGVVANLIIQSKKEKQKGFPLIPYLAAGFMAAFFI